MYSSSNSKNYQSDPKREHWEVKDKETPLSMTLETLTQEIGDALVKLVREKFAEQGHNLTGKFSKSLGFTSEIKRPKLVINLEGEEYGGIVNAGTEPSRIPYSPGSGRSAASI